MKKIIFIFSMMVFALSSSYAYTGYYWKLGNYPIGSIYTQKYLDNTYQQIGEDPNVPNGTTEYTVGTARFTLGSASTFRYFVENTQQGWAGYVNGQQRIFTPLSYIKVGDIIFQAQNASTGGSGMLCEGTFSASTGAVAFIYHRIVTAWGGGAIAEISW